MSLECMRATKAHEVCLPAASSILVVLARESSIASTTSWRMVSVHTTMWSRLTTSRSGGIRKSRTARKAGVVSAADDPACVQM